MGAAYHTTLLNLWPLLGGGVAVVLVAIGGLVILAQIRRLKNQIHAIGDEQAQEAEFSKLQGTLGNLRTFFRQEIEKRPWPTRLVGWGSHLQPLAGPEQSNAMFEQLAKTCQLLTKDDPQCLMDWIEKLGDENAAKGVVDTLKRMYAITYAQKLREQV